MRIVIAGGSMAELFAAVLLRPGRHARNIVDASLVEVSWGN